MAIKITDNGYVQYENQPDTERTLFPNIDEGVSHREFTAVLDSIITEEYSNSSTYSAGDVVLYGNKIYIANTDISTAEDFNSEHWNETSIYELIEECVSHSEFTDVLDSIITEEYSNLSTYSVGDVVLYENKIYRANTAISTAEDFNSEHWNETSIYELINFTDITAECTVDDTYVSAFHAHANHNTVYVNGNIKSGASDQTEIVTKIPDEYQPRNSDYAVLSSLWLNSTDATKNITVYVHKNKIKVRCTSAIAGSSGVEFSGMWVYK